MDQKQPDGPKAGMLLFPVTDSVLSFNNFLFDNIDALDRASGRWVTWRLLGNSRCTGENYEETRSEELRDLDLRNGSQYEQIWSERGTEKRHIQRETEKLAERFNLQSLPRPLVIFDVSPSVGRQLVLFVDIDALDTGKNRRELASILIKNITEETILKYQENGVFTEHGLDQLQDFLKSISIRIRKITKPGAKYLPSIEQEWISSQRVRSVNLTDDTIGVYWINDSKELCLSVNAKGRHEGTARFKFVDGGPNRQRNLMLLLFESFPNPVPLGSVIRGVYCDDLMGLRERRDELRRLIRKVQSLVSDIRRRRLKSAGINPEILKLVRGDSEYDISIELALNKLHSNDRDIALRGSRQP